MKNIIICAISLAFLSNLSAFASEDLTEKDQPSYRGQVLNEAEFVDSSDLTDYVLGNGRTMYQKEEQPIIGFKSKGTTFYPVCMQIYGNPLDANELSSHKSWL